MSVPARIRSAKVMLLGDIGVGKTSLAKRLVFDRFDGVYKTTIGVDVLTHDVSLSAACNHDMLRLVLWDTDGDFGQTIFSTMYIAGASGAVIVADATRPASFERMEKLMAVFSERFPGRPALAVVNKADLATASGPAAGVIPGKPGWIYTSALTGAGVQEGFLAIAETIWRRMA